MKFLAPLSAAAIAGALVLASPAFAEKTAKECNAEWTANKATLKANGTKKKDFIAQCRSGSGTAATTTTPAPTARQNPAASAPPNTPPAAAGTSRAPAAAARGAGQFSSEAQAKAHCPGDTVVWANLDSRVYHFTGNRSYGNTKSGAFMCEKESTAEGYRAAKNEKHP